MPNHYQIQGVFSCPGSSIHNLGQSMTGCHFWILTQRVTFDTWDPSDIWSEWCLENYWKKLTKKEVENKVWKKLKKGREKNDRKKEEKIDKKADFFFWSENELKKNHIFFKSWKSFKRERRFSSFAKKEKYDCCISLLLPKTEKYIHRISLFFCIYVTALNDYDDFDQSLPALGWLKKTKSDTALSPHFHFHNDRRRRGWG